MDFVHVGIDQDGVAQITAHIQRDRSAVQALSLGCNSRQDEGAALLAQALSSNCILRALHTNNNGCQGFAALSNVLVRSNTSEWLELDKNPIFTGSESSSAVENQDQLANLLAKSVGLKYLGLSETDLW